MALYHRYRPTQLSDIVGNKETVTLVQSMLDSDDPAHAMLIIGPTGCGKTTLGRIIARELGAVKADFVEVDSADFRGIDTIRAIRKQSLFLPQEGGARVFLLDECHKMSNDAQNALLKALEDSPPHVYYILCTTDPQNLIKTIKSRCSIYEVTPLNEDELLKLLRRIVKKEEADVDVDVLEQIVASSEGRPREALQILDQVMRVEPEAQLEIAKARLETQERMIDLCRALMKLDKWEKIAKIVKDLRDEDAERMRRAVLGYFTAVLVNSKFVDPSFMTAVKVLEQFERNTYDCGYAGFVTMVANAHVMTQHDAPF